MQILERLGKGAQGSVYLVVHKQEKKKYVLKQVRYICLILKYYFIGHVMHR